MARNTIACEGYIRMYLLDVYYKPVRIFKGDAFLALIPHVSCGCCKSWFVASRPSVAKSERKVATSMFLFKMYEQIET